MIQTNIGLSQEVRSQVSKKLSFILANQFVIYVKTLKFHWNVRGKDFKPLHLFLEEQYEQMLNIVDDVAERIRALGFLSPGTMQEYLKDARLTEAPGVNPEALDMLKLLLLDHEEVIQIIRKEVDATAELGDMGTNNFLSELMEKHEKMAWMLRAFLE